MSLEGKIITQLAANESLFRQLFEGVPEQMYMWKPAPEKWSLLEILCHLYDEEIEDFRARVKCTMETPELPPPPIDPEAWVSERKYIHQDYSSVLNLLLKERKRSIKWLESLENPQWDNEHVHPTVGPRSARFYLANWLAHDFLHVRQIMKLKYQYWQAHSGIDFNYAGVV